MSHWGQQEAKKFLDTLCAIFDANAGPLLPDESSSERARTRLGNNEFALLKSSECPYRTVRQVRGTHVHPNTPVPPKLNAFTFGHPLRDFDNATIVAVADRFLTQAIEIAAGFDELPRGLVCINVNQVLTLHDDWEYHVVVQGTIAILPRPLD